MSTLRHRSGPRRQWGADRQVDPMPVVPRLAAEWTLMLGRAAVVVTVGCWLALVVTVVQSQLLSGGPGRAGVLETIAFLIVVTMLAGSASAYLVARLGFYYRARRHRRVPRALLDEAFSGRSPSLTALVPSYEEEESVIRMTLLSAALQEYPDMRVVLLIDDPPEPGYAGPYRKLEAARALPEQIQQLLAEPRDRFDLALVHYEEMGDSERQVTAEELATLAESYEFGAGWLRELVEVYTPSDHNERFFANHVLGQLASDLALTGAALRAAADDDPAKLPAARVLELYRRLAWTFRAELSSFERKRHVSLSADPTKAMNLNSYIGLMGGRYREELTPAGRALVDAQEGEADLVVPHSDYILTLDADSVILPEYCLRLVYLLERAESHKVAVAQSPHSAFPGAATRIERIAGATTDLQHIIHQGMTFYGASFWVGANAILRKQALDDVEQLEYEGGWPIRRYIQDRTVIEDTESTIDLAAHGWATYNYPERLSYSATPPDFGSLCIQRHGWANGGLLIIPKLRRCMRERRWHDERTSFTELLLRMNYMASGFWSSLSVLFLMVFRFNGHLLSPLTYMAGVPYFLAMAMDLRYCGYKRLDVLRIYGFNLLLLPVKLAGSLSSIVEGPTGAKGRFMRTPKVRNRTVPAFVYVVLPYVLVGLSVYTFMGAYRHGRWGDAGFAAVNAILAGYAIVAFVGIRHSLVDIWTNVISWLYKPQRFEPAPSRRPAPPTAAPAGAMPDWELVLYQGFADRRRRQRGAGRRRPAPGETAATEAPGRPAPPGGIGEAAQPGFLRIAGEWPRPET